MMENYDHWNKQFAFHREFCWIFAESVNNSSEKRRAQMHICYSTITLLENSNNIETKPKNMYRNFTRVGNCFCVWKSSFSFGFLRCILAKPVRSLDIVWTYLHEKHMRHIDMCRIRKIFAWCTFMWNTSAYESVKIKLDYRVEYQISEIFFDRTLLKLRYTVAVITDVTYVDGLIGRRN